jgi:hypothetical protein
MHKEVFTDKTIPLIYVAQPSWFAVSAQTEHITTQRKQN